jgi:hypothetical protein
VSETLPLRRERVLITVLYTRSTSSIQVTAYMHHTERSGQHTHSTSTTLNTTETVVVTGTMEDHEVSVLLDQNQTSSYSF